MEKTDDELIAEYRSGDYEALQVLFKRYTNALYGFTYRMTHKSDEAEDITQETFIKVWKMLPSYKMTNTFKSWIFTIARNTTIDRLRKKKSNVFSDFDSSDGTNWLTETITDEADLPDELVQKAQDKKLLDGGLETLAADEKEILLLHYSEDMTFDAIGKILKKPLNTIKSKHRRALAKLREYFEQT